MAVPEWNPDDKTPYVYLRMADHVAARITAGDYPPGAMLPNERELVTEYGVSIDTVRRATAELRSRGLVVTYPSRGTYVADHALPGTAMARDGRPRAARGRAGHGVLRAPGCAITRTSPERHSACDTLDR